MTSFIFIVQISQHLQAEAGEEFIALQLMKKLRTLQAEKVQLVMEVDREEEHMTNNLQRQLTEARQAKVDLENQLEAEQESIVHRMHRQIQQNAREKAELVSRLESLDAELVLEMQSCSQAQRHVFVALASALGIEIQSRSPNSAISSSASTPAQSDISSILESAGLAGDSTRSPSSEDLVRVAISILDRVDARLLRSAQKRVLFVFLKNSRFLNEYLTNCVDLIRQIVGLCVERVDF
jgi:isoleucyl-tRNA synthetase